MVGLSRNRISEIVGNTIFGNIDTLLSLSQGQDMNYIADHYNLNLALAWALHLEGKADQEKFKELGWGFTPGIINGILTNVMSASKIIGRGRKDALNLILF